ncbi:MAG: hypothetical protein HYR74_08625 [Candidatus Eisenbacteria bacterium]|nr:hypothetical protein [Candidatus Eisenbacteria bacterium]
MRETRSRRRPHGWGSLLLAVTLLLVLAPLAAHAQGADTVTVSWTAPGDDGNVGTATAYELRLSTSAILTNDAASWNAATVVQGVPAPLVAGTRQRTVVRGLTRGTTYWLAIKTVDDAGNWSPISNIVRWDWVYDTAPPGAPSGVSASKQSDTSVHVTWAANSEPDLNGYDVYRATAAGGPYVKLNGALVSATDYLDNTIASGTAQVWYQVTALDNSGNESARSASATVNFAALAGAAWVLQTGYPNPSSAGTTVRIPIVVPGTGGSATLEIVNDAGQRITRRDLGTLVSGTIEVTWDGRNDSGRQVAPGVYTAWLITGSTRTSVRLVRVP